MNIRDLEYLVALDELRNFRKASERCHVTQPTLSGQLRKLEEHLGVLLVERTKRKVILTPVGKEVVRRALRTTSFPTGVRITLRLVRSTRRTPRCSSNFRSCPLRVGWVT